MAQAAQIRLKILRRLAPLLRRLTIINIVPDIFDVLKIFPNIFGVLEILGTTDITQLTAQYFAPICAGRQQT